MLPSSKVPDLFFDKLMATEILLKGKEDHDSVLIRGSRSIHKQSLRSRLLADPFRAGISTDQRRSYGAF
jgi:hypothetical protein